MVPGTCIIPGTTAVCSKECTAPHDTAPQSEGHKVRHRTALLSCTDYSRADLLVAGGALFGIQQRSTYKPGVVLKVPVRGMYWIQNQHGEQTKTRAALRASMEQKSERDRTRSILANHAVGNEPGARTSSTSLPMEGNAASIFRTYQQYYEGRRLGFHPLAERKFALILTSNCPYQVVSHVEKPFDPTILTARVFLSFWHAS